MPVIQYFILFLFFIFCFVLFYFILFLFCFTRKRFFFKLLLQDKVAIIKYLVLINLLQNKVNNFISFLYLFYFGFVLFYFILFCFFILFYLFLVCLNFV